MRTRVYAAGVTAVEAAVIGVSPVVPAGKFDVI